MALLTVDVSRSFLGHSGNLIFRNAFPPGVLVFVHPRILRRPFNSYMLEVLKYNIPHPRKFTLKSCRGRQL